MVLSASSPSSSLALALSLPHAFPSEPFRRVYDNRLLASYLLARELLAVFPVCLVRSVLALRLGVKWNTLS